jgi:hypothetical protein
MNTHVTAKPRIEPVKLRRRKRMLLVIGLSSVSVLTFATLSLCQGGPRYYREKYSPTTRHGPKREAGLYILEQQTEPHTCGFHSVSTIYRAFGLDPDEKRLRFRLGTDAKAHNFDETSVGTLHPDMLRVMEQDGFACELLLQPSQQASSIAAHLDAGFPVIVLTKPAGLHWTVLTKSRSAETAVVFDSLHPALETVSIDAFVCEEVIHAILVKPSAA